MNARRAQAGLTLVVSMIMLIVLTLLVVSAIRFGNINLKITGNAQTQTEAGAAAQVAIEQVVQQAKATNGANLNTMAATTTSSIGTGGQTYTVSITKPSCNVTKNVDPATLDPTNAADRTCFGATDPDRLVTSGGTLTSSPTACKDQLWDISATVNDGASGAQVNMLQGVSLRVDAKVSC